MAAAALAPSRGLFLTFTLLFLVCHSSPLIDEQKLEQLRETYQKVKEIVDRLKVDYERSAGVTAEILRKYLSLADPIIAEVKEAVNSSPGDFPPLDVYAENMKNSVLRIKAHADKKHEELGESIKETERELGKLKKCIQFFEEQQAEL